MSKPKVGIATDDAHFTTAKLCLKTNRKMALKPRSESEPFLYLLGVKNAIFCKFLYLGF